MGRGILGGAASAVAVAVTPTDVTGSGAGTTTFSRTYASGSTVTLTAPATVGTTTFSSWSGCASVASAVCTVVLAADTTVTAIYTGPAVSSVTISPSPASATLGMAIQFAATVQGTGAINTSVTWSVAAPAGSSLSPGTITNLSATSTSAGLYTTPYPAPPTVTVTATSNQDATKSASAVVTLTAPAAGNGPALSVDAGNRTHAISPLIYGMNAFSQASSIAPKIALPLDRWGGDSTTRYNYLLDAGNAAGDWYYENFPGSTTGYPDVSQFNTQVALDKSTGTKTLGTMPLIGWTTQRTTACSFSVTKYGAQKSVDPYRADCGLGVLLNGARVVNDPTDTSTTIDETFDSGWVKYLVGKFGSAASGGVAIYDLDNEPEWWDAVHIDVHPKPFNYDELTTKALTYAAAIKAQDPTAEVSGPVISYWMDFFYSKQDIETGWASGPCYCQNGNPTDRLAHGDIPLIEYYLQQFQAYQTAHGVRLLDYLDLHTYFVANNLAFSTTGDTAAQQARLNSTRVFWDPTYTDPNYTDPNNRTSSAQPYPPQLIPMMKGWVAKDYPGTKLAITEYNWGGQEAISGALAQADILGIFGREGLDLATLWGTPDPVKQVPGLVAYEVFRNYDGALSQFGDVALASTSANQAALSVYGASRTADGAVTVVVINKTYGDLTSTLSLAHLTPAGPAKVFLYNNANLTGIVPEPNLTVTPPPVGSTTSSVLATFPAQSITILVIPTM